MFGDISDNAQGLLLVLCSGSILGWVKGLYRLPEIGLDMALCKASTLPLVQITPLNLYFKYFDYKVRNFKMYRFSLNKVPSCHNLKSQQISSYVF